MLVTDFEDLRIYQMSRELVKRVYALTKKGDFQYDSRFVQQIRAAAGSISDNIAEGFERQGSKEFKNFLYIAKGSCGEVRSQINRAYDISFITDDEYHQLYNECRNLSASILRFIQSIDNNDIKGAKYAENK